MRTEENRKKTDKNRMGVSIGSGVGSLQAMEREHKKLLEKGPGRISPMLVPMMITNMAAGISKVELNHKEVQETADRVAKSFKELVTKVVVNM